MTVPLSRRALLALPAATLLRAASPLFTFRESFWLNLHHFLYVLGRLRNKDSQYARSPAIADTADLSNKQQAGWETAVTAYSTSTSKEDLVFDRGLARFTKALSETADNAMPGTDTSVGDALRSAGPIYREIWWPRHSAANRHRIPELQDLIAKYGDSVASEVTRAYEMNWPPDGFQIQMSGYANWSGSYSTDDGLIVLSSTEPGLAGTQSLEIAFHEAVHQWDDQVQARLSAAARKLQVPVPRQLSHSLIFYTTGYATAKIVPGHVPYAEANGLWNNRGLIGKNKLDQYWKPHLEGKKDFDSAATELLQAL